MNNEPLKNDASELGPDDESVSRLLCAMKRVEAPNDFDFKVRARIAAGRPAARPAFGIPAAIRYAVPLVVLVLVGAYFGLNAYYSNRVANMPVVAHEPSVSPVLPVAPLSNEAIITSPNPAKDERADVKKVEIDNIAGEEVPVRKLPGVKNRKDRGGSIDSFDQMSKPGITLHPRGLDQTAIPASNSKVNVSSAPLSTKEILNLFGLNGVYGESGWKVESVSADTLAGRSGVKAGDVIEAINNQVLTEKMSFKGSFNGKTLRVRRDGATMQIVLKN